MANVKKLFGKTLAILLVIAMVLGMSSTAFAAPGWASATTRLTAPLAGTATAGEQPFWMKRATTSISRSPSPWETRS